MDSPTTHKRPTAASGPRERGLTLIELMIVITIAAALLAIGVPNFQNFLQRERLASSSNELFTSLQLARSEALKRNQSVVMAHNGTAGSGNWSSGWVMFVDLNSNGTRDTGEDTLRTGAALPATLTAYGSNTFSNRVSFAASGALRGGGGLFVICSGDALQVNGQSRSRAILVNGAGRVRIAADTNGDGVPETDAGAVTSCTRP